MKPGDIVKIENVVTGWPWFWEIQSVCIGSRGHESLVELKSLTEDYGTDTEGNKHLTTWVPASLLIDASIYGKAR